MSKVLEHFLEYELQSQESYEGILNFVVDQNIRSGEYEGNEYIIQKIERLNFLIYKEYVNRNTAQREIYDAFSIFKKELHYNINNHAKKCGFSIIRDNEESNEVITTL